MKQAYALKTLVMILAVSGCTAKSDPVRPAPGTPPNSPSDARSQLQQTLTARAPEGTEETGDPERSNPIESSQTDLEATLPKEKRDALHAGAQALVNEFVGAFSRGDQAAAEAKLISREVFDEVVAPGFQGILGSGLLSKNQQELANLIEALQGHKVESWNWKPGTLVQSKPGSAFSRPLTQITGGTIELEVDGTYIAVRLDQLIELDGKWTIFQMHNL